MSLYALLERRRAEAATPKAVRESLGSALGLDRGRPEDQDGRGEPVGHSDDLKRILALPRRPEVDLSDPDVETLVDIWTKRLLRPGGKLGGEPARLRPIQAVTLSELKCMGGTVGSIGIGHGKELLSMLAPMVLPNCKVAVLLIPSELREQFHFQDWPRYSAAFKLPNLVGTRPAEGWHRDRPALHVITYGELHHKNHALDLEKIAPDFIIANEAQALANRETTQTRRVIDYFAKFPRARFLPVSGTFTKKSLKDFAHLVILTLRGGSPVPLSWAEIERWACVIDDRLSLAPSGKLALLCEPGESVRVAFGRRFRQTPGVISTKEASTDVPLRFESREVTIIPETIRTMMRQVEREAAITTPDGQIHDFREQNEVARCLQELACGFYYRWIFPRGETPEQIEEWLKVRKQWFRELRGRVAQGGPLMDSAGHVETAARRAESGYKGPEPVWKSQWFARWEEIRDTVQPETQAVWIDDFLIKNAMQWGRENVGVIWCHHVAFAERLAKESGFKLYRGGKKAGLEIQRETGERTVIASITAHHRGKNLQMFNKQLVASPPGDGGMWEQMIGRLHRAGQKAGEVLCVYYSHVDAVARRLDRALSLAKYIEEIMSQPQRLLTGSGDLVPR